MNIAHIAPTSFSSMSAAWRIRKSQEDTGHNAFALVHSGTPSDSVLLFKNPTLLNQQYLNIQKRMDGFPLRFSRGGDRSLPWSAGWVGPKTSPFINRLNPDIVNFHWLSNGYFNLNDLENILCPVVLTMHDVWPVTAGCHCNLGCQKWLTGCFNCPQLGRMPFSFDFGHMQWARKKRAVQRIKNFAAVTPSKWLQNMALKSPIYENIRIERIENCVDQQIFFPGNKAEIRARLGIPQDKTVIAFGAVNATTTSYKGYKLLIEALRRLKERTEDEFHLVVFGGIDDSDDMPFATTFFGSMSDEKLIAEIYQLSDIFVTPSQQDNFPSTLIEAASCGLPLVGFDVGGIPEIIRHKENGYVAKSFDIDDFANGISWVSQSANRLLMLGQNSRDYAIKHYSPEVVSSKYIDLYRQLLMR